MTTQAALAFGSKGIERDSIAMEWTIPIQTLDTSKVCISTLTKGQKPMAAFSYTDGELQFHSLSVLLPSLVVKSYDMVEFQSNTGIYSSFVTIYINLVITIIQ